MKKSDQLSWAKHVIYCIAHVQDLCILSSATELDTNIQKILTAKHYTITKIKMFLILFLITIMINLVNP